MRAMPLLLIVAAGLLVSAPAAQARGQGHGHGHAGRGPHHGAHGHDGNSRPGWFIIR
jgi:hypothetical protein